MTSPCPACCGDHVTYLETPAPHYFCHQCRHRWNGAGDDASQRQYYSRLRGRNDTRAPAYAKKTGLRLAALVPLLREGMRILEIGCADGDFGRRVKQMALVDYTGIELSEDALIAQDCLDRVLRMPSGEVHGERYDLLLSYHVLEHIEDVRAEVGNWHGLLKQSGRLIVEVPNEAGHPLMSWDANIEHRHHFTATSLAALLDQAGFSIQELSAGHFESSLYSDSLRVVACPRLEEAARRTALLERFRNALPDPFVVYGIGGDFRNYVAPLLPDLQVKGLVDSDPAHLGVEVCGIKVEAYDPIKFAGCPILVASCRHQEEITATLLGQGVPPGAILGLDAIFA